MRVMRAVHIGSNSASMSYELQIEHCQKLRFIMSKPFAIASGWIYCHLLQLRGFVSDVTQRPMVSDVKPKVWQVVMLMITNVCQACHTQEDCITCAPKFLQVNQALKLMFVIDKQNYDATASQNTDHDAYSGFMTLCKCWTKHNVLLSSLVTLSL